MTLKDLAEFYRDELVRISEHDPATPGLHYDSIEQLLGSAVGCAKIALKVAEKEAARLLED